LRVIAICKSALIYFSLWKPDVGGSAIRKRFRDFFGAFCPTFAVSATAPLAFQFSRSQHELHGKNGAKGNGHGAFLIRIGQG
jgi:hypothetical protein